MATDEAWNIKILEWVLDLHICLLDQFIQLLPLNCIIVVMLVLFVVDISADCFLPIDSLECNKSGIVLSLDIEQPSIDYFHEHVLLQFELLLLHICRPTQEVSVVN